MKKVVNGFEITRAEDESGQFIVKIGRKVNSQENFLEMTTDGNGIVVFRTLKKGLSGGRIRVSIEALQTALEMLSDSVKPNCDECPYMIVRGSRPATMDRPICRLAHCFIDELGGVCLKTLSIEEVRRLCGNYLPPEDMDDNKSCCLAHLAEARAFCCSIDKIEDLLRCEDYDLEVPEKPAVKE